MNFLCITNGDSVDGSDCPETGRDSMSEDRQSTVSRRDVLKKGAIATGGLVIGGTAIGAAKPEGRGGTGYVKNFGGFVPDGGVFRINSKNTGSLAEDFSTSCNGNGATKTYTYSYGIRYYKWVNGCLVSTNHTTRLWVKNEKDLRVGDFYMVSEAKACPDASDDAGLSRQLHAISFGPLPNATACP